ncbi:hypothetical protein WR25_10238 isoform A [Diploscapter pachys]|uniref:DDHD domain-containing protein n=2 Tax=Diploscapter pachys TaxID=2018661 RepID=A0A2A2KCU5_9BILA|nr:hypothetical protein WR25_10238 isoform A [Diploscapter pachys]
MLVKEYRILLPLTVEEYRIAQLYMIQKKSRLESHGKASGVEIIANKPYTDGPGGSGQYTFKIYHIGNRIPAWIRSILPTNALEAHEESYNAYPLTKTRYSQPMMDRFSIEVDTLYYDDAGHQENVFGLSEEELKNRIVDVMDFVKDPLSGHDYCVEEDPKLYRSEKTGRGPLNDDWVMEHIKAGTPIMCAYKLCKVEFRYWGMQSRAERWIHDLALRNTMLRAHRQAWAWQDEWVGLTMADIRRLEHEAALHLSAVMASDSLGLENDSDASSDDLYFDCTDMSPPHSAKPTIVRWSSELELVNDDSPPPSPHSGSNTALLIIIFHGDFSPDHPAETKTTDMNTFKTTIDNIVHRHYPQLKGRVHMAMVSCGMELSETVSRLSAISPSFGSLHPSLSLVLPADCHHYNEVFVVGDAVGGIFLYESLTRHEPPWRLPTPKGVIKEGVETPSWSEEHSPASVTENGQRRSPRLPQNVMKKKISLISCDSLNLTQPRLYFHPSTAFLLGCPLGLVLMQRKLQGFELAPIEGCQIFNLFYPLDGCGARIEPVLNPQFSILPPYNVPRYQRFPLGDGKPTKFEGSIDAHVMWGTKRIDQLLYCPNAMVALPSSALPNILHASYWESTDVAAFVIRQFVRGDETVLDTLSAAVQTMPLNLTLPQIGWKRKRTRFKIANLAPNHRANDVLVVEGVEQILQAKFCYGPMDLVALSHELVSVFVCPQRGEWLEHGKFETENHGRLNVSFGKSLPCGLHSVKIVVHGDRSYLDALIAVVPPETRCVAFSVDGSLTASVSVTGKDPRVRAGAVDVVRYWHERGILVIYVTARPDMQQRVISAWLSLHNFPQGLLFFNPSFSTEPLKQKAHQLKHLVDMGLRIHAAYGSSKDVAVYTSAGVPSDRIVCVSGSKRKTALFIDSYSHHLSELNQESSPLCDAKCELVEERVNGNLLGASHRNVSRTSSFTPRGGRL